MPTVLLSTSWLIFGKQPGTLEPQETGFTSARGHGARPRRRVGALPCCWPPWSRYTGWRSPNSTVAGTASRSWCSKGSPRSRRRCRSHSTAAKEEAGRREVTQRGRTDGRAEPGGRTHRAHGAVPQPGDVSVGPVVALDALHRRRAQRGEELVRLREESVVTAAPRAQMGRSNCSDNSPRA